jgi:hypothetical protein
MKELIAEARELLEAKKKFTLVNPTAPFHTDDWYISEIAQGLENRKLPYPRGAKKLAKDAESDKKAKTKLVRLMKSNKHVSSQTVRGQLVFTFAGDTVAWEEKEAFSIGGPPTYKAFEVVSFNPKRKEARIKPQKGGAFSVPIRELKPAAMVGRPMYRIGKVMY